MVPRIMPVLGEPLFVSAVDEVDGMADDGGTEDLTGEAGPKGFAVDLLMEPNLLQNRDDEQERPY